MFINDEGALSRETTTLVFPFKRTDPCLRMSLYGNVIFYKLGLCYNLNKLLFVAVVAGSHSPVFRNPNRNLQTGAVSFFKHK